MCQNMKSKREYGENRCAAVILTTLNIIKAKCKRFSTKTNKTLRQILNAIYRKYCKFHVKISRFTQVHVQAQHGNISG